jgi:hypothetical protein
VELTQNPWLHGHRGKHDALVALAKMATYVKLTSRATARTGATPDNNAKLRVVVVHQPQHDAYKDEAPA